MIDTTAYIGTVTKNHFGTPMKIIGARKKSDIDVQFLDAHSFIWEHNTYRNFIKGEIKNPFDKNVFGVGYFGIGEYKSGTSKHRTPEHYVWRRMLERCYDKNSKNENPTYYGIVSVCDEWHCFQTFAKWYCENRYEVEGRLHIDKDILHPECKLYSPDTCLLVPQRINMLFVKHRPNSDGLPEGIRRKSNGKYTASYQGRLLGTFETIEEAIQVYTIKKKKVIIDVANKYKQTIPDKLYQALIKYEVIIK